MKEFQTGLMFALIVCLSIACSRPSSTCTFSVLNASSIYEVYHADGSFEAKQSSPDGKLTVTKRNGESCSEIKYRPSLGGFEN